MYSYEDVSSIFLLYLCVFYVFQIIYSEYLLYSIVFFFVFLSKTKKVADLFGQKYAFLHFFYIFTEPTSMR